MNEPHNLDGCYFRIQQDGKSVTLCFSDLTPEERAEVLSGKDETWLKSLCCHLADVLQALGEQFKLFGED